MVHRRADSKINFFLIFTVHEEVGRKQYKKKNTWPESKSYKKLRGSPK